MTQMDPELITEARKTLPGEVPFDFSEMFFSRTDGRGVIAAGNDVFRRVSGYDWNGLLGAPHKVVRHTDTPKALFHFMWARLKSGKPIGAYVKNRSQDGRHYWVFALATPVDGGYTSVRIKPSSAVFEQVKALYADLCALEAAGTSPADSAATLLARLEEMGYPGYDAFEAHALAQEISDRAQCLDRVLDQDQKRFMLMAEAISKVQVETTEMTETFKAIRTVPMNMRILASRLENAGGPISAISVNYGSMLDEMAAWVRSFVDGRDSAFARIRDAILRGQFLTCASAVQSEMIGAFAAEKTTDKVTENAAIDLTEETNRLEAQKNQYARQASEALFIVETEAGRLSRSVLDMKRYVTGLSSTRMMCKIESATLSDSGDALGGIVDQLDACQNEIEARLAHIVELNAVIQANTALLRTPT